MIVDDEAAIRESLAEALADELDDVQTASHAKHALELLRRGAPVVLTDVRMPEMDGIGLLREIRRRTPQVDVVLMTAFDDMPVVASAMREGAADFLVKPLDRHVLRRVLSRVVEDRRTRSDAAAQQKAYARPTPQFIGRHPQIIEIYKTGFVTVKRDGMWQVKWMSTITSRMLLSMREWVAVEEGWATRIENGLM
jgi:DNA-binding NtrC family response regulator